MKKIIFVTGGHFTPAKAVIEELIKEKELQIYYLGRKHALEGDKAISLEYQEMKNDPRITFLEITTGRPQRKFTSKTLESLLKIPLGFLQSFFWICKYRPNLILSFGGYVAIPIATIAYFFRIPIVHHEQVLTFDYPSRYLAYLATKVLVSFPALVHGKNSQKWTYTGNPLRPEIFTANFPGELEPMRKLKEKKHLPLIYVTGGNQGSHVINKVILGNLSELLEDALLIWQIGDSQEYQDFQAIQERLIVLPENKKERLVVKKFFLASEIGGVYTLADLVIARSGANTVFELAALGKPALLIPIPWVHHEEQQKNALTLAKTGLAVILDQDKLESDFLETLRAVVHKRSALQRNAVIAKDLLVKKDSAAQIARIVLQQLL